MFRLRLGLFLIPFLLLASVRFVVTQEQQTTSRGQLDVDIYGNIYILNTDRNTLKLFAKDRSLKREVGGSGWENDQFDRPSGLWARNGIDVFVADYGNHRIQRFDRHLSYVSTLYARENPDPDERFGYPTDVAVSRLGDLFICDSENSRIVKVNRFTQVERTFGGFSAGNYRRPRGSDSGCRYRARKDPLGADLRIQARRLRHVLRPQPGFRKNVRSRAGGTFCSSSNVGHCSSNAHTSSVSNRSNHSSICGK